MKHTTRICLALALAFQLTACGENKAAPSTSAPSSSTSSILESAKTHLSNVPADMKDVSKSISELETKSASMTGEPKTKLDGMIASIKAKKDDIVKMMSEMQTSPAGMSLDGVKAKIDTALAELKKMISDAMAAAK